MSKSATFVTFDKPKVVVKLTGQYTNNKLSNEFSIYFGAPYTKQIWCFGRVVEKIWFYREKICYSIKMGNLELTVNILRSNLYFEMIFEIKVGPCHYTVQSIAFCPVQRSKWLNVALERKLSAVQCWNFLIKNCTTDISQAATRRGRWNICSRHMFRLEILGLILEQDQSPGK